MNCLGGISKSTRKTGKRSSPLRVGKSFTLIELLVVIAIIAVLVMLLLPVLGRARQVARRSVCLSNLKQMNTAVQSYVGNYNGFFPPAMFKNASGDVIYGWDFTRTWDYPLARYVYKPGLIWEGWGTLEIQQCPSFAGATMSEGDMFSGYNYNASYLGWVEPEDGYPNGIFPPTARIQDIQAPTQCAVFGDGEYGENQANKYMRAPQFTVFEKSEKLSKDVLCSGTQGFRHFNTTNVAFADGHCEPRGSRYSQTYLPGKVSSGTGFLSADNQLYDLE